jgi:hypothetical protein
LLRIVFAGAGAKKDEGDTADENEGGGLNSAGQGLEHPQMLTGGTAERRGLGIEVILRSATDERKHKWAQQTRDNRLHLNCLQVAQVVSKQLHIDNSIAK